MGNTQTTAAVLPDFTRPPIFPTFGLRLDFPKEERFLIERILAPDVRVGVVSGSGAQGLCLSDGKIRRLQTFQSGADELNYMFEGSTSLKVYRCGTTNVCYDLMTSSLNVSNTFRERIPIKFKPISTAERLSVGVSTDSGDSTKEIDALAELFKPRT